MRIRMASSFCADFRAFGRIGQGSATTPLARPKANARIG